LRNVNPTAGYPCWGSPAQASSAHSSGTPSPLAGILGQMAAIFRLVGLWRRRARDRALLARFDDRMLRDIGLTPADVMHEINRPFWRE
jgi:uncharacterized protein YjiS (DUF1127 family)